MVALIDSLRVRGMTSLGDVELTTDRPVTVLVGANGAGKSNLVNAFEVLGRIHDRSLQQYVLARGGMSNLLRRDRRVGNSDHITLDVTGGLNGYHVALSPDDEDGVYLNAERVSFWNREKFAEPYELSLGSGRESGLLDPPARAESISRHVSEMVAGCRVYHFQDTSPDAPVKIFGDMSDDLALKPDAANLAARLWRLQDDDLDVFARIERAVKTVAPFFGGFVLSPGPRDRIRLRWRERQADAVFSASALSDGTLRFICLAAALLDPARPRTIVFDEPELGLHPFAINQLLELIRASAVDDRRIVMATQSVTLLNGLSTDEVAVLDRAPYGTVVRRLDPTELVGWLEEYSLGELWQKNVLGGRPRSDEVHIP